MVPLPLAPVVVGTRVVNSEVTAGPSQCLHSLVNNLVTSVGMDSAVRTSDHRGARSLQTPWVMDQDPRCVHARHHGRPWW